MALWGMAVVVVAATPACVPEWVQSEVRGVVVRPLGRVSSRDQWVGFARAAESDPVDRFV
jgi:hypothetical protein